MGNKNKKAIIKLFKSFKRYKLSYKIFSGFLLTDYHYTQLLKH